MLTNKNSFLCSRVLNTILGGIMLLAGLTKAFDISMFSKEIAAIFDFFGLLFVLKFRCIIAFAIITFEFVLGFISIIGKAQAITTKLYLIVFSFFLIFTGYFSLFQPELLNSCGCFGQFINVPPLASFVKNVVFLFLAVLNYKLYIKERRRNNE